MSHMDGYFDAALDNASGMAVMMALAEHFAQVPQSERRREITFIATAGHHVGSPSAGFMRDNPETLERVALMLNCEHIAPTQFVQFGNELRRTTTVSPRRWWVHGSDQVLDIVLDAYRTFGVSLVGRMDPRATGEMGQIDDLAPSVQLIRSPEHKHTDLDVPELVSGGGHGGGGARLRQDRRRRQHADARGDPARLAGDGSAVAGEGQPAGEAADHSPAPLRILAVEICPACSATLLRTQRPAATTPIRCARRDACEESRG